MKHEICPYCHQYIKGKAVYLDVAYFMYMNNDIEREYTNKEISLALKRDDSNQALRLLSDMGYLKKIKTIQKRTIHYKLNSRGYEL